jgi:hypothetical protein
LQKKKIVYFFKEDRREQNEKINMNATSLAPTTLKLTQAESSPLKLSQGIRRKKKILFFSGRRALLG